MDDLQVIQIGQYAADFPTEPFKLLEPQNLGIGEVYFVARKSRSTDFEALKL